MFQFSKTIQLPTLGVYVLCHGSGYIWISCTAVCALQVWGARGSASFHFEIQTSRTHWLHCRCPGHNLVAHCSKSDLHELLTRRSVHEGVCRARFYLFDLGRFGDVAFIDPSYIGEFLLGTLEFFFVHTVPG